MKEPGFWRVVGGMMTDPAMAPQIALTLIMGLLLAATVIGALQAACRGESIL